MTAERLAGTPMTSRTRIASVDQLRGVAMVLMALDHVRDFFSDARFDPTDLRRTTFALFATRWITHTCAPSFVLLAGLGAYLQRAAGKSKGELARFLATRGLWLVLLELTVVHVGWCFNLHRPFFGLQVIWALGVSMVALSALVFLPMRAVAGLALGMIALHDLADGVHAEALGAAAPLWHAIHEPGPIPIRSALVYVAYPVVPWIGVMALGYAMGPVLALEPPARKKRLFLLGAASILLFAVLRGVNRYGDPSPWVAQSSGPRTLLSFVNCEKYPPSLDYLLMTLGPACLLLGALERWSDSPAVQPIAVFGRVPLFYYLLHLPLIHGLAVLVEYTRHGAVPEALLDGPFGKMSDGYGVSLGSVYAIWASIVLVLYPACVWYAGVKQRSRHPALSYL